MKPDAATLRQNRAAEPDVSTWLSANAGSGKTRVLTDRVARLLLERVSPQNILCLTYTKAAASEMQNRLFRRLGDWSMAEDRDLLDELGNLGIGGLDDPERLAEARRLFARAIETPGGLRIQTIHSFCSSILRRFPMEAGASPAFTEMDDRASAILRNEILDELADGEGAAAVDAIAAEYSGENLTELTDAIARHRQTLSPPASPDEIREWFGLPPGYDEDMLLREVFDGSESELVGKVAEALRRSPKATDIRTADSLAGMDFASDGMAALDAACDLFVYGANVANPFTAKTERMPTKDGAAHLGPLLGPFHDLMRRVEAARETRNSLRAARKTAALHLFAGAFLPAYERRKELLACLDFDDLIGKTGALLNDPAASAWVLYRLDSGLDHILVDEAQDTSPEQWQIIERLAQEFTSGIGAHDGKRRTIFVVGDRKQSIYSFQGADPAEFERMRRHFDEKLQPLGEGLRSLQLEHSFRSSGAILRFVDEVFRTRIAPESETETVHRAFHEHLPGRVDLWPTVPKAESAEPGSWTDPVDLPGADDENAALARAIAARIAEMIGTETIPRPDGSRRPVRAGDVLILVRRRSALFAEIIRACKAMDLPIAGADRLKLGGELAVRDLAALLRFAETPDDDLSLAVALKSPLFGWDEARLFDLAVGRDGIRLWRCLRERESTEGDTVQALRDILNQVGVLRPYDLIERVLTRHGGRERLLARLGPEAEDGIDSLLSQALSYERADIPSLTGFLAWLETDDVEIKRQLDDAGDRIRAMTVHGAKGLESPIVILPDTARRTLQLRQEILTLGNGQAVWKLRESLQPDIMRNAVTELRRRQEEEAMRLYYVAATRAETWLIVCAAGKTGEGDDSWHGIAETALGSLGAVGIETPVGEGLRHESGDWAKGAIEGASAGPEKRPALPEWARKRAERPGGTQLALSPSRLGGAKAIAGEGGREGPAAMALGQQVHRLLECLPAMPEERWSGAAASLLRGMDDGPLQVGEALEHAERVLRDPELAWLFAEDVMVERDLTATLPGLGGRRVHGAVDRLLVSPDRVLAGDLKTNATIPESATEVPVGLLRQMGAYLEALEAIYGDRPAEVAILWTAGPKYMPLPREIALAALRAAAPP